MIRVGAEAADSEQPAVTLRIEDDSLLLEAAPAPRPPAQAMIVEAPRIAWHTRKPRGKAS